MKILICSRFSYTLNRDFQVKTTKFSVHSLKKSYMWLSSKKFGLLNIVKARLFLKISVALEYHGQPQKFYLL